MVRHGEHRCLAAPLPTIPATLWPARRIPSIERRPLHAGVKSARGAHLKSGVRHSMRMEGLSAFRVRTCRQGGCVAQPATGQKQTRATPQQQACSQATPARGKKRGMLRLAARLS